MAVKRNYRINLRNYGKPPAIMVSQYDENYDLVFEVYDGVVPATGLNAYTVKLVGRQPGNDPALKYEFEGTVSGALNNVLSFTIDTTMTGRAGKGTAEIVILDTANDVKFASFNLPVYVEKAAVPDDAIDADVERAQEIADEVQDIVDTAAATVKGEAESWAVGERDGEPVPSTDPTYHNNAKYYAEQAQDIADSIGIDATLSISGKAADAKKTGDEISSLKEDLNAFAKDVVLCVSTYRDTVRDSAQEYYYAISYDGGKSFYEIKDSVGFAGSGIISSDVQPIEWNDGLLMVATAWLDNYDNSYDFKATYTRDFYTYYSATVNLGFLALGKTFVNSPYVWAPHIFKNGNDYYAIASVSIGETQQGDVYSDSQTTRYLYPYAVKVNISFDTVNGLSITADGELFRLTFENDTASIIDVALFKDGNDLYCVYKDRIRNITNIAKSTTGITGEFKEFSRYIGRTAYIEAGYFTKIGGDVYCYFCGYSYQAYSKRIRLNFLSTLGFVGTPEYIGVINSKHYNADHTPIGMRNPYPIELSKTMQKRLAVRYNLPTVIGEYVQPMKRSFSSQELITRISDYIYDEYGYYTEYPAEYYIPRSSQKVVDGETINCKMCFSNLPTIIDLRNSGDFYIRTPYGSVIVHKETDDPEEVLIEYGRATVLSNTLNTNH